RRVLFRSPLVEAADARAARHLGDHPLECALPAPQRDLLDGRAGEDGADDALVTQFLAQLQAVAGHQLGDPPGGAGAGRGAVDLTVREDADVRLVVASVARLTVDEPAVKRGQFRHLWMTEANSL